MVFAAAGTQRHHHQVTAAAVAAVTMATVVIVVVDVIIMYIVIDALFLFLFGSCHFGGVSFAPFRSTVLEPDLRNHKHTRRW